MFLGVSSVATVLLKRGPQSPSESLNRTWKRCNPPAGGDARAASRAVSIASSKVPSAATIAVALPCPGSVSQKYSAPVIVACCDNKLPGNVTSASIK